MTDDAGEIVVLGYRNTGALEQFIFFQQYQTIDEGGAGSSPPPARPPNPPEIIVEISSECAAGAAEEAAEKIKEVNEARGSDVEIGGIIVEGSPGTFGIDRNGLHTNYSPSSATIPIPNDMASIRGVIHNHVYDNSVDAVSRNFNNRYPSDGDWSVLDALANPPDGRLGATQPLSIFILDPFGTLREFKSEDRETFESMTNSERNSGDNLPPETNGCP